MKSKAAVLLLVPLAALAATPAESDTAPRDVILFDDFSADEPGAFPAAWQWRHDRDTGDPERAVEKGIDVFRWEVAEEDGNRYLHIRDEYRPGHTVSVFMETEGWDLRENPILRWRWRVNEIPPGADERYTETNDTPASIMVVYGTRLFGTVPIAIKWVWSSTLPVGAVAYRPGRGRPYTIVVGTGDAQLGEWVTVERDLVNDYVTIFGKLPPNEPRAITLSTDANRSPGAAAEADYDDIQALSGYSEGFPKEPFELLKEYMKDNN